MAIDVILFERSDKVTESAIGKRNRAPAEIVSNRLFSIEMKTVNAAVKLKEPRGRAFI